MTDNKDFKRVVRARMSRTGESYTAARAALLDKTRPTHATPTTAVPAKESKGALPGIPDAATLASLAGMSNEAVAAKTGRDWTTWTRVLDQRRAFESSHAEIARHVAAAYELSGWWSQTVTVGYERIRGLRDKGQRRGGSYEANKSRTYGVPVERLFAAFSSARRRARWLAGVKIRMRKATDGRSIRFDWGDGTRVSASFQDKGTTKSTVSVQHSGLATRDDVDRLKAYWGERLDALGETLTDR